MELVALLNSAQALRRQFLQWPERFNMNRDGDLAALYEIFAGRRSYDWEKRLKAIVEHLHCKYAPISKCHATRRVGDLAMNCSKNGAFESDELVGDIIATLDDSTDPGALHCTTLRGRRDPARRDSTASSITLVDDNARCNCIIPEWASSAIQKFTDLASAKASLPQNTPENQGERVSGRMQVGSHQ
jgi:hypothetical protein